MFQRFNTPSSGFQTNDCFNSVEVNLRAEITAAWSMTGSARNNQDTNKIQENVQHIHYKNSDPRNITHHTESTSV
jgi:hypothetical protein